MLFLPLDFSLFKRQPRHSKTTWRTGRTIARCGGTLFRRKIVFLRRGFLSFCGRMSRFRARLTRKNSRFPPALRSVQGSRLAQSALTEKCDFRWRELNFIWVQRHAAARFTSLIRKMRTAHFRGNGVENIDFQRLDQTLFNVPTAPQRTTSAKLYRRAFHALFRRAAV